VVICLDRGANDLHMVQLMPLPPHYLLRQWHQLDQMQTICTSLQTDNHTGTSPLTPHGRARWYCIVLCMPGMNLTRSKVSVSCFIKMQIGLTFLVVLCITVCRMHA